MKKLTFALSLPCTLSLLCALSLYSQVPPKPKLVLFIAADQFRADYLQRFRAEFREGFDVLLSKGAVFANAHVDHFPTVTATGHSTFLSGATPAVSGIVDNMWYDRASRKPVTSVSDDSVRLLGATGDTASSPRRLLVSTLGDELKIADRGRSRVIGISLKDRGAILPSGHMADGAFWFDWTSGNFVSSTYYFPELPRWVRDFNAQREADRYKGLEWMGVRFPSAPGEQLYTAIAASPYGNELVEALAERAIRSESLGRRGFTDLLAISFSSNDLVGHAYGPDSPQVREISIQTDRLLGKLFRFIDEQVGLRNVIVVFTADHGVVSAAETNVARNMPGGRVSFDALREAIQKSMEQAFGKGDWVAGESGFSFYLNRDLISAKKLDEARVERLAAHALLGQPHVSRVYTRSQLADGRAGGPYGRLVLNGFNLQQSGDIFFILDPYWTTWIPGMPALATTHGSPYAYDTHVPMIFMGPGLREGTFYERVTLNDIAPTLSAILGIQLPSGSVGAVLDEAFESALTGEREAPR